MRFAFLMILVAFVCQCKTTSSSANRRMRIQPHDTIVFQKEPSDASIEAIETEQAVTVQDVDNAPALPVVAKVVPAAEFVRVQEIGSQCQAPVTANCLGISSLPTQPSAASPDLGKALKKYGRLITPALHACNYYTRNLANFPNISYFSDLVVYWSESAGAISYWAFPVNFIFSAGCSLGEDFKNPFASDLKGAQRWDGTTTLKSLGYAYGSNLPLPATFLADRLKAEKIPQDVHKCSWAIRPMIYAFPDGVIYQFVGGTTINVYSYSTVTAQGCYLPTTPRRA